MLDCHGYRPNVGIILLNSQDEVFWAKRIRENSWQFPQGGINQGESPTEAMFRELYEEVGLRKEHVKILGRTRNWLRYTVPEHFVRKDSREIYRGQKQIWFLLRLVNKDSLISLRATKQPEFDAWRWHTYWVPLEAVIEFKRQVYLDALNELSVFLEMPKKQARVRKAKNVGSPKSKGLYKRQRLSFAKKDADKNRALYEKSRNVAQSIPVKEVDV